MGKQHNGTMQTEMMTGRGEQVVRERAVTDRL